jgi:hypothetical protein
LKEHEVADHNSHVHYEKRDINPAVVFKITLGLLLVTALVAAALVGYIGWQQERATAADPADTAVKRFESGRAFPAPQLQETPTLDIQALHAHENQILGSYGWVDRDKGLVRVPIEEAMRLTLERGLPARGGAGGTGAAPAPPPAAAPAARTGGGQ